MRINVYKLTYHTIRFALQDVKDGVTVTVKKDAELSRTSPETAVVAAQTLDEAVSQLPNREAGVKNVLLSSQMLQHDIPFQEKVNALPQAKQPQVAVAPAAQTKPPVATPAAPAAQPVKP